ncbi:MAG TPA: hypothetical protein VJ751_11720 [Pyrinomonadaceae bacterium]|nr:hypothetical protein [Pyrinomonadaceae bacterium]
MSGLLLLDGRERIGAYGRLIAHDRATSHAAEDEEVEEVHPAEDEEHQAYFDGQGFNALLRRADDVAELQGQANVAEVDQIEADDEQVIDGVGEGFVAMEDVDEEDSSVFVEGTGDPDGQGDADGQVNQVCAYSDCHGQPP